MNAHPIQCLSGESPLYWLPKAWLTILRNEWVFIGNFNKNSYYYHYNSDPSYDTMWRAFGNWGTDPIEYHKIEYRSVYVINIRKNKNVIWGDNFQGEEFILNDYKCALAKLDTHLILG